MPKYPSSATGGTYFANYGERFISNLTNYQELKDITIGYGSGTNDTTTVTFNSAAKYPTDVTFGNVGLGSSSNTDLVLAIQNFAAAGYAFTTAVTVTQSAQEQKIGPSFGGNSFFNLQSKIEKATYELNRLATDLEALGQEASSANLQATSGRRYPSSFNRFTNTAGGI